MFSIYSNCDWLKHLAPAKSSNSLSKVSPEWPSLCYIKLQQFIFMSFCYCLECDFIFSLRFSITEYIELTWTAHARFITLFLLSTCWQASGWEFSSFKKTVKTLSPWAILSVTVTVLYCTLTYLSNKLLRKGSCQNRFFRGYLMFETTWINISICLRLKV